MAAARQRRNRAYSPSSDEDETSDENTLEEQSNNGSQMQLALREKEEALVESALARIRKAQRKGKKEVKLNKEELAALERRRKRLQEEEARKSAGSGSDRRRKDQEARFAVPLAQLEPTSRKRASRSDLDEVTRHRPPPIGADVAQRGYPQMGYFPPPQPSGGRPRSGTGTAVRRTSSRDRARASRRESSPFKYSYVQQGNPPRNSRHVSDTAARQRSSRALLPHEEGWQPSASDPSLPRSSGRRQGGTMDPFQYMTSGPQAPYHDTRHSPGHSYSEEDDGDGDDDRAPLRRTAPAASGSRSAPGRGSSDTTSQQSTEEEETSSGDQSSQGARIPATTSRRTSRDAIVVEEEAEAPERERHSRSSPKKSSPVKRKHVGSGSSSRRRKGRS
jgi:PRA1 family protein 1